MPVRFTEPSSQATADDEPSECAFAGPGAFTLSTGLGEELAPSSHTVRLLTTVYVLAGPEPLGGGVAFAFFGANQYDAGACVTLSGGAFAAWSWYAFC